MQDDPTLRLPVPEETFDKGPALCTDIDGVIAPSGVSVRPFVRDRPPDGFIRVYGYDYYDFMDRWRFVHPALPDWLGELEAAYAHCAWLPSMTSYATINIPKGAGQVGETKWPHLEHRHDMKVDIQASHYFKTDFVRAWVAPEAPLALVDIHLPSPGADRPDSQDRWRSVAEFLERPGPTLLVSPFPSIGLSRSIVDLLCRFARDPHDPAFAGHAIHRPHLDPYLRWPDPIHPELEEPVLLPKTGFYD